jgi:hypothetical protein
MTDQQQPPHGFDPYPAAPSSPPPYRFDPVTGEPVAGAHAAPVEGRPDYARIEQLEAETGVARPCPMTAGDLFMSLNGFDEIAVVSRFGATIPELRADAITLGRALAFVHYRRRAQGQPGADESAYQSAMALTIQQISHEFFQPEPEPQKADDGEPSGEAPGVA